MDIDLKEFIKEHKIPDELHEKWKMEIFKEIIEYLENNPKYILNHRNSGKIIQENTKILI